MGLQDAVGISMVMIGTDITIHVTGYQNVHRIALEAGLLLDVKNGIFEKNATLTEETVTTGGFPESMILISKAYKGL